MSYCITEIITSRFISVSLELVKKRLKLKLKVTERDLNNSVDVALILIRFTEMCFNLLCSKSCSWGVVLNSISRTCPTITLLTIRIFCLFKDMPPYNFSQHPYFLCVQVQASEWFNKKPDFLCVQGHSPLQF